MEISFSKEGFHLNFFNCSLAAAFLELKLYLFSVSLSNQQINSHTCREIHSISIPGNLLFTIRSMRIISQQESWLIESKVSSLLRLELASEIFLWNFFQIFFCPFSNRCLSRSTSLYVKINLKIVSETKRDVKLRLKFIQEWKKTRRNIGVMTACNVKLLQFNTIRCRDHVRLWTFSSMQPINFTRSALTIGFLHRSQTDLSPLNTCIWIAWVAKKSSQKTLAPCVTSICSASRDKWCLTKITKKTQAENFLTTGIIKVWTVVKERIRSLVWDETRDWK